MCRRMPGAIRARDETIAQRESNTIAALVMHRTFLDRNDSLGSGRVVAHDHGLSRRAEDKRHFAAKTGF